MNFWLSPLLQQEWGVRRLLPRATVGPTDAFLLPPAGEGRGEGEWPAACSSHFWPVLEWNRHPASRSVPLRPAPLLPPDRASAAGQLRLRLGARDRPAY